MNVLFISDWIRDKAGRLLLGSEFSVGIAIFGITLIGLYYFGKMRIAGFMLLGLGLDVYWGKGKDDEKV